MSRKTSERKKSVEVDAAPPPQSGFWNDSRASAGVVLGVALVVRLLAAWKIPALTYDGVFYLRQSMRILQGSYRFESFPPGLPLLIAPFGALGLDLEHVARCIDVVAGIVSVGLFYWLARRHLGGTASFVLALLLAVHPSFVRVQVEVLSEPLYIVLLLAAFLLYEHRRTTWCGLLLGAAFLTRPEGLVLLPGLALAHVMAHRKVPWGMLVVGLIPVAAFSALSSREVGHFVLSAKQGQLDLGAAIWERTGIAFKTLHAVFPVVLVPVALLEGLRRRSIYLLPLLYLAALPFYDIHIQQRLLLPAALFLALLSAQWLQRQTPATRQVWVGLSLALLLWGTAAATKSFFDRSIVLPHSRQIGAALAPHLAFDDKVAARFPFIPYYAGAGFVRIENLSYESILDSIQAQGATHLLILENEAVNVRPQLRDLFENDVFARTESRLRLVQKVEQYPFERAVLYALQEPPIPATVPTVPGDFRHATWFDDDWIGIDTKGQLQSGSASAAAAILRQSWRAHSTATLQEMCVAPGASQVAVLEEAGPLHVYDRADKSWKRLALAGQVQPRSPCWVDAHTLLFVEGNGRLRALDTRTERVFEAGVTDIPDTTPVLSVATRHEGGGNIAITYLRANEDNPLLRAIATTQWPASVPENTQRLELPLRWGTIVSLHDDRVAWVPGRDQLIVSAAILLFEEQQQVGDLGRLSLIQQDGQARRLAYHDPQVHGPQTTPLPASPDAGGRFQLLYLGSEGILQRVELSEADLQIPDITVLRDPQLRP